MTHRGFSPDRRHAPTRILALAGTLMAAALVLITPLDVAAATPYGANLVKNAGAESGLSHWDTFANFTTHKYGAPGFGFPSKANAQTFNGGTHFFYSGLYDNGLGTCGDASQEFHLSGIGSAIDSGHVKVFLKGRAGTNGSPQITAHLDLYFRNSENHQVASNGITRSVSGTNEKMKAISASKILSRKTRILRVHLWADGDATISSGDCAAFWDKISVVIKHV